jgi:predicted transcriptional regulator
VKAKRKGRGRPPAGDTGEEVRGYPKMTVMMKPATKAQLKALSLMTRKPAWRILDQALADYVKALPAEDRRALESLAKRVEARQT